MADCEKPLKKYLSYNMTKVRIKNTKYLDTLGRRAQGDAEAKVNEVIKLYREGKVSQISTAENMNFKFNL